MSLRESLKSILKFLYHIQTQALLALGMIALIVLLLAGIFLRQLWLNRLPALSNVSDDLKLTIDDTSKTQTSEATTSAKQPEQPEKKTPPEVRTDTIRIGQKYTVKSGDTLFLIAQRAYGNGNLYPQIQNANHLGMGTKIVVGQKLFIPKASAVKKAIKPVRVVSSSATKTKPVITSSETKNIYVVVPKDSLWKISQKEYQAGKHWPVIYRQNKQVIGKNPNLIYPKTRLVIPKK